MVKWTEDHQKACETLKYKLISTPILAFAEYSIPFELHVYASSHGLGDVLYQKQEGKLSLLKNTTWHTRCNDIRKVPLDASCYTDHHRNLTNGHQMGTTKVY